MNRKCVTQPTLPLHPLPPGTFVRVNAPLWDCTGFGTVIAVDPVRADHLIVLWSVVPHKGYNLHPPRTKKLQRDQLKYKLLDSWFRASIIPARDQYGTVIPPRET